jgi:hypothetical protein
MGERFFSQIVATKIGMGAVLYQLDNDAARSIISYVFLKFSPAEYKYHLKGQECHAVVW